MKYVILCNKATGYYNPMVFSKEINHKDAVKGLVGVNGPMTLHSAGFVNMKTKEVYGDSESLKARPKPGDDAILKLFLEEGVAGVDLENYRLAILLGTIHD